ncbi:MAG: sensor histidine kinase [Acutalibacteraceae bacterium]
MSSLWYPSYEASSLGVVAAIASAMATVGILLEWLTSVARNLKRKQFWRNTLLAKLFRFFKKNWRRFKTALHHLKADIQKHAIPKHHMENLRISILFLFIGYLLGNVILVAIASFCMWNGEFFPFFLFGALTALFNLIVLILFWKSVIALDEMMTAVSKTRQGDLSYPLTPSKMPKLLRKFGEDIIGMQEGMRTAVDEAIKGEHMKTELITNVSHDLKTPLTAIVNYVDLLKKCEISDETAREYIGVLEEKSERLKHLIEDLVEASKATTGNVKLNFVKVNLYELAMQAMGENADALEAAGLDVRLNQPEQEPILFADSQKTWRIIDNLISNVKKYALAGTRVYIEVGEENGAGVFAIKNVSREPLDVPIEQLTQRFVRGDASRSTEGSGLGLSIAQSLCELQSGTLEITMDGDLFKVTVRLPLADR